MKHIFLLNYEPDFSDIVLDKLGMCPNSVIPFTNIDAALYAHEHIVKSGKLAFISLAREDNGVLVNGEILVEDVLDGYDRGLLKMKLYPEMFHEVI